MRRGFDSEDPKAHINNPRRQSSSNQSRPDLHSSVQESSPSSCSSSTYASTSSYSFDSKIAPSNRVIDFGASSSSSSSTSFPSASAGKSAWLWPTISSPLCREGEDGPKRAKKPNDLHEDRMTSSAFVGTKSVAANSTSSNSSSSAVGGSASVVQPSSDLCSTVVPFVPSARHDRGVVGGGTLLGDSSGLTKGEGRRRNSDFRCSSPSPLTFSNASSSLSSPLASTSSSVHFSAPTCAQQQQQPLQERYVEEQKPFEHFLNSGTRNLVNSSSESLRLKQEQDKVGLNRSQTNPHQHQHHQQQNHLLHHQQQQHQQLQQNHPHHQQQQQQQQQQPNYLQSYQNPHHPLQVSSGGHTGTSAVLSGHNATMQPATDYLRPYIHYPATAAALYHSAATMAPTAASRLEQTGLGDRTVPFPSINLAASQHPIATNYSHRYDTGLPAHHQALYSSSYSAFESPYTSQITPTTHIPLGGGDYPQHPQQHHSAQPQNQQHQQRYFLARPQPTRLLPASAVSTDLVSPQQTRSQTSPYSLAAAKMDNILNNNNNNSHQHHNNVTPNTNTTSSPHNPNVSSPSNNIDSNGNLSPASDRNDASSNKFRYPSGANNSVQSSSASSPPHMDRGGGRAITPSSALSSREGTPMPSTNNRDEPLAPNVDISKVQAKEIQQNNKQQQMQTFMQSQVTAAGPTAVGAAAPSLAQQNFHFGMGAASSIPTRGFVGTSPSYFPSSGPVNSMLDSSIAQRPPKQRPPREASLHVKIGRRPAHLPKVLKFTDKTLPSGWIRKLKQRKHGKQAGRWDVYIYSPCGVKFASRKKLKSFFEKNNLTHDPEDFDFTPYGRHIESRTNHASNTSGSSVGTVSSSIGTLDSSAASRHNSSGSTGSNGTHPGSCSPASISYSPTYSLNSYIPPSMAFSTASTTTGAGLMPTSGSSFVDYNNFQFDPHMDNPPNANVLDVPPNEFNPLGGGSPLPYAHLGRGHHHPIMNKGGTMGSEFFPSSEMADLIGSSTNNELHNGYSTDLKMGLQSLGGSLTATKLNDDQDLADKINNLSSEKSQGASAHQVASTACYSTAISVSPTSVMANPTQAVSLSSVANSHGHENAHEKAFSLGRTINMLQGGQEGFEDSYFYD